MKNFIFFLCLLLSFNIFSQIQTPAPSPATNVQQTIGLTDITLEYARPSVRNRVVFGNLVPFNKIWRTGANENSIISFSTSIKIGDTDVPAGKYSVYTIPNENSWEFILYSDYNNWGLPSDWDENKVVVRQKFTPIKLENKIESFKFALDDLTNNSFTLGVTWGYFYLPVEIKLPTTSIVMSSIEEVLKDPTSSDLYKAAVYLLQENRDLRMAKEWMNQSIAMMENPRFYQLRQQSLIYAALKDYKMAIKVAKSSLEKSILAGNADYEKMNQDSISIWSNM
jgi:tetratricopeptide (TPR) repeat protein